MTKENKMLFELQEKHKGGDAFALSQMYLILRRYAKKCIIKIKNEKGFFVSKDDVETKSHDAAVYLISRYKKVNNFEIKNSFTGYISLRVKFELWHRRKVDGIVDFVDLSERTY